ncbi:neutral/alkaline non-lysosomal ceramidase N-terminal domain-containing protein [Proteiniclasticum sp. SCR006]|uniref:Neutral/alkaline non-lysosomal ceramidase N-terminal domain-containing protein n=1 Tax=Proteiniclasticum aestuarii TaxID=2817862 RepID=A0A939HDS7_9CLOT|nr:neutral/alkaline non-lysosomal ceramidase N-terminal domain-containing protein [Proteiniclasticum aestuarii]MBO1266096.1 neutral/alkaline non-lysosomal ceramidase N-terminal domain-containing protein [Proteiniclasticum aestuarii]
MLLGTSKTVITPLKKLRLAGYATREAVFDDVLEDIYIRVYWLRDEKLNKDEVIIYGDLIWFSEPFVEKAIKTIRYIYPNLAESNICFIASHNHSGPPTGDSFTPLLETYDDEYAAYLLNRIIDSIRFAEADKEEISAERYTDRIKLNVYRRVMLNNKIEMMPNYDHYCNHELNLIVFKNLNDDVKGMIVHYPCHANISNENKIMPDFPGITLSMLENRFEDSVSIYMQGATADIRPNVVLGNKFTSGNYAQVVKFSSMLYDKIISMIESGQSNEITIKLEKNRIDTIRLPQDRIIVNENILKSEDESNLPKQQWYEKTKMKNFRLYENLKVQYLSLGDELEFFFFNAEMSQSYESFIKKIYKNSLAVSYANGMIGYISSSKQIEEGGYEPVDSAIYFALSGTYKPEIEKMIMNKILELGGYDEKRYSNETI